MPFLHDCTASRALLLAQGFWLGSWQTTPTSPHDLYIHSQHPSGTVVPKAPGSFLPIWFLFTTHCFSPGCVRFPLLYHVCTALSLGLALQRESWCTLAFFQLLPPAFSLLHKLLHYFCSFLKGGYLFLWVLPNVLLSLNSTVPLSSLIHS